MLCPPGEYRVKLSTGDPSFPHKPKSVLINGTRTAGKVVDVRVSGKPGDSRITVTQRGEGKGDIYGE